MNQATEQATARPWYLSATKCAVLVKDSTGTFREPTSQAGKMQAEREANAALIVEAVNQHSALLAVAEAAKAVADHASQSIKDLQRYGERSDYNIAKPAIERLKSALSQLETTKP